MAEQVGKQGPGSFSSPSLTTFTILRIEVCMGICYRGATMKDDLPAGWEGQ